MPQLPCLLPGHARRKCVWTHTDIWPSGMHLSTTRLGDIKTILFQQQQVDTDVSVLAVLHGFATCELVSFHMQGLIAFDGELLLQGVHDDVDVILLNGCSTQA